MSPPSGSADDAQLDAFVSGKKPPPPLSPIRVVATGATLILLAVILWPTRDELLAHFGNAEPIDVADPSALKRGGDLPLGSTVRLHGVLGNRAAVIEGWRQGSLTMGPVEVRQVLGAPVFVQFDPRRYTRFGTFTEVDIEGRVADFGPGTEIPEVREYLKGYGIAIPDDARLVILDEGPGKMTRYVTAWTGGLSLAILSVLSLVRRRSR